jgi:glycine betaine/proline transport system permease protein
VTATLERRPTRSDPAPPTRTRRAFPRGWTLLGVVVCWLLGWVLWKGHATLEIGGAQLTGFHTWLNGVRDSFDAARATNWFFQYVIAGISNVLNDLATFLQDLMSTPTATRPVPDIGWLGVLALLTWIAYVVAGLRSAVMVAVSVLLFGLLGYWQDSIDTLIITLIAVVICVVIGLPLGIWMARSRKAELALTPVLDLMQTIPPFAYLAPLALVFAIGAPAAIVTTLIYALPPLVRITAHGVRSVSPTTIEATASMGSTRMQTLRKVQLPMARRTIAVGVNQCTMAALSMTTIAAFINGPGLGQPVVQALQSLDIGTASVAGLLIVVIAIMLDRTTTAASERSDIAARTGRGTGRRHKLAILGLGVVTVVAIYVSRLYLWAARFPTSPDLGTPLSSGVSTFSTWLVDHIDGFTTGLKNVVTYGLLNPLQSLLAESPWWLIAVILLVFAAVVAGRTAALTTLVCEAIILGTGLWNETMNTFTTVLVATLLVVVSALVIGVFMGRNRRVDLVVRPFLDTLQTLPPFVYLVPALALFGPTRFTAIVAALAYGVPIATKLVADGVKGVSPSSVEAARAAGTTAWQMISKVQLPMARAAVVLASNQGLLYVLSMVVIGGMVGGGGLGYLVYAGFSQGQLFGKGLAAAIAITALGVMLDRIAQHAAARYGRA